LLAACVASTSNVRMPDGRPSIRIECHYDAANYEREAHKRCRGNYEVVRQGDKSCANCGFELGDGLQEGNHVDKGVLYVRCVSAGD
jgi:hypothetical protein